MLFPNANREVLSGSRIRMRTTGRGQDVRPEKTLYLHLEKQLIFLHAEYFDKRYAPPTVVLSNNVPNHIKKITLCISENTKKKYRKSYNLVNVA